tara:strand:- start:811 stop:1074 length:264 start_codon:yes stop_codon:yes gene_type:complete
MTTITDIKNTPWAKRFKAECPTAYDEAIRIASETPCSVIIYHAQDQNVEEWKWVVESEQEPGFWLDAFDTEDEARELVREMGWIEIH